MTKMSTSQSLSVTFNLIKLSERECALSKGRGDHIVTSGDRLSCLKRLNSAHFPAAATFRGL